MSKPTVKERAQAVLEKLEAGYPSSCYVNLDEIDAAYKRDVAVIVAAMREHEAALTLTWTTEKPIVPGWYWWRYGGCDRIRYVHSVDHVQPAILRVECPDGWYEDIHNVDGEWAGPVQMPKEGA